MLFIGLYFIMRELYQTTRFNAARTREIISERSYFLSPPKYEDVSEQTSIFVQLFEKLVNFCRSNKNSCFTINLSRVYLHEWTYLIFCRQNER